jgi:nitrous oxidase accessory protein NosD
MAGASSAVSSNLGNQRIENSIQVENNEVPSVEWNKTYGGSGADVAESVIQTSDGGYALAGSTQSFGHGGSDMWLVKTDASGNILWNQTYGSEADEWGYQVVQTGDGGYAIVGTRWNQTRSAADLYMVRTNASGDLVWDLDYIPSSSGGSADWGDVRYIVQASDGSFVLCGSVRDHPLHPTYDWDAWVIKVSSSGQVLWDKPYFSSLDDGGGGIIQTSDGGYAFVGATLSWGGSGGKIWLVKIDANGNQQWVGTYGGGGGPTDNAYSLVQTSDAGYVIAGYTYSSGAGSSDFCLIRTDSLGKQIWFKTYGGVNDDQAHSMVETTDGGYLLAGYTNSFGAGGYDFWLVKTDSLGNMQWNQTYGGANDDVAYSVIQTSDGGYAVAGYTYSFGAGSSDMWLIKLAPSSPRTITVPDDYPTIQAAINAANDGDTVFVRNGTYYEHVVVNKTLSLLGESKDSTIIDGSNNGYVVDVTANNVNISQFLLRNAGSQWSGVNVESSGVTLWNNIIMDNHGGVWVRPGSLNTTISGNKISNTQPSYADGIRLWSSGTLVVGNIITNESSGIGVDESGNTIEGNLIANNSIGIGNSPASLYFHNSFVNNGQQATAGGSNTWDAGYPSGGNYWSDYNGTDLYAGSGQNLTGSDGIGDTPYVIDANNTDNYPLMRPWTPPDIAITNLTSAKTVIGQGYTGSIDVTFENLGSKIEALNVTVYANSTCILSEQTMWAMTNCTLSFNWNTTGFDFGNYTISACALPVEGETNTANNNLTGGTIFVGIQGDINNDGTVNILDAIKLGNAFLATSSSSNWNPNADINNDGIVNILDAIILGNHFLQHFP